MSKRLLTKLFSLLVVFALVAAACGDDDTAAPAEEPAAEEPAGEEPAEEPAAEEPAAEEPAAEEPAAEEPAAEEPAPEGDLAALGLWDDGPCDESLDTLHVGLQTVFASGVLTLEPQAQALEASAEAFNARGGANGHCIQVTTCDDSADPNQALECVRTLDEAGIAATVNDTTSVAGADVSAGYAAAGIPRFAISPGQDDYPDTNSYPFDAGGTGTTIMMAQGLLNEGITKIGTVRVDIPAGAALVPVLFVGIFGDDGGEFVTDTPVPAGTTDYSQFVLAAEDAGAEGLAMPLGGQEAIQVLTAARDLGSELMFSGSLGTFPYADIAGLGDFASQIILNAAIPPATFDDPVVDLSAADLGASGIDELQRESLESSPMRSWVGLYALLYILREAGTEDFSRENVKSLIDSAQDIPMLGLMSSDWTPATDHAGAFIRTGSGDYQFYSWDPAADYQGTPGNFVLLSEANFDETICGSAFGGPCS